MIQQWRIGCSGFYYSSWKEVFYPKGMAQKDWFAYYCRHFNTLELNVTFYRFPGLKSLQNWYRQSPEGFVFAAKVPRTVTHDKKLSGTEGELQAFYGVLRNGLAEKTGPVLFQLPPSFHYAPERLDTLLRQVDPDFHNVIEFRHISWWRREVTDRLGQANVSFCGVSFPGLISDAVVNTQQPYYRFHGVPKLYYSAYDPSFLEGVVQALQAAPQVTTAYLYFNNTAEAAALDNARYVQELTGSRPAAA